MHKVSCMNINFDKEQSFTLKYDVCEQRVILSAVKSDGPYSMTFKKCFSELYILAAKKYFEILPHDLLPPKDIPFDQGNLAWFCNFVAETFPRELNTGVIKGMKKYINALNNVLRMPGYFSPETNPSRFAYNMVSELKQLKSFEISDKNEYTLSDQNPDLIDLQLLRGVKTDGSKRFVKSRLAKNRVRIWICNLSETESVALMVEMNACEFEEYYKCLELEKHSKIKDCLNSFEKHVESELYGKETLLEDFSRVFLCSDSYEFYCFAHHLWSIFETETEEMLDRFIN